MPDSPEPFGRYLLLERIAVGGMAEIFKAKARGAASFEKVVAVKRILPNYSDSKEFVEMFIDEANIAATLTHANICQIYELGEVDALHYIAMEFVDGRDLQQITSRLARQKRVMPPPIAARICIEVLRGV